MTIEAQDPAAQDGRRGLPGDDQLFENAFRHAPIGMALVSLEGLFLRVNDAFCAMLGYSAEEMLVCDFQTLTHPDDLDADLHLLAALTEGRLPHYQMEKRYFRKDATEVWVSLSVSMVSDDAGRPLHYIAQVKDLTERRLSEAALRDSEARYRLMSDNMTDLIVVTDITGTATFVSPSCRSILGYEPEDLVGSRLAAIMHPDEVDDLIANFRRFCADGAMGRLRWRVRHKTEGRWVWLESNPSRLTEQPLPGQGYVFDTLRDVTAQIAQEEALAAATVAAEAATRAKSEFLANMSHEIRTPLTAVIGFTDLLHVRADLDPGARGQVERVNSAGKALLSIVNDILDFSKLEAGRYELTAQSVSPVEVARDALLMFTPPADAKGLALDFVEDGDLPAFVALDPIRLRQILLNLIGNAIKFTDTGGITLTVGYAMADQKLRIAVRDTGVGLTPSQQAALFERFSQVGNPSAAHGGTGLGLAICRGLAEAMGGAISVHSAMGEGSTFLFDIDAPEAAAPTAEAAHDAFDMDALRVLVVDDNPSNRELVRIMLEGAGIEVTDAVDGQDGVDQAAADRFDIILMDMRMPRMTGDQALRVIRGSDGPNRLTPVLAFSAEADVARWDTERFPFDGFVRKPLVVTELMHALAEALDAAKAPVVDAAA